MKNIKKLLLLVLFLLLTIPVFSQSLQSSSSRSDTIISLLADEAGLPLVAPLDVPRSGTFWLVFSSAGMMVPMPCPPQDGNLPIYSVATGQFIVDETANERASAASLLAQMAAVSNLITRVQHVTINRQMRAMGMEIPFPGEGGDGGGDYTNFYNYVAFTFDTNQLWLEITNVSGGLVMGNLHNATNEVYALWGTTNLLTPFADWQIEQEVFPTDTNYMPFTVSSANADTFFLKAEDLTGVYLNGLPAWWTFYWFGGFSQTATNLDSQNNTLGSDFTNNVEPNIIGFSLQVTNNYVTSISVPVQLTINNGVPARIAVSVDDTNYANDAGWQDYTGTNIMVTLGLNAGWHDVWIGLKGPAPTATATWQWKHINLTLPPVLTITQPASATVDEPMIQIQGYCQQSLAGISYDISNATGVVAGQLASITDRFYDTNNCDFTTNYFKCIDVPLTNGLNTITFHASNLAGDIVITNFNFIVDYSGKTNPPAMQVNWPSAGTQISGSNLTVRGWVADPTVRADAQVETSAKRF